MKQFWIALGLAAALCLSMGDADARRLGGGSSVGRQSSSVTRQAPPPAQNGFQQARPAAPVAPPAGPAIPAPKPASPWKGVVGGLIGGALLGAAFSHLGLGGAASGALGSLLTLVLLVVAVLFIVRMFKRNAQSEPMPAYAGAVATPGPDRFATPEIGARLESGTTFGGAAQWSVPADFDTQGFLRNAKTYFIRLQAAWDKGDVDDLREFTTPEMFAELRMQLQERGAAANVTDVLSIEAELLGIETSARDHLASVRFTGTLKESAQAAAEPFSEVWNLAKPVSGQGGWVLAGIQQA